MCMHGQSVQFNDHIMFGVWLSVSVVFSESAVYVAISFMHTSSSWGNKAKGHC